MNNIMRYKKHDYFHENNTIYSFLMVSNICNLIASNVQISEDSIAYKTLLIT